jgi:PucR family transcriptional regulator, purine catabolism regulatory protein
MPENKFTVADVLQLDGFQGARVVGGAQGVDREVEWVHNVGVPDAPNWLNGGELAITTGFNLPQQRAERETYLHEMIAKRVAGLCISVGRYLPEMPDYLCTIADEHDFPLIAIPYQARFIDLVRTVNQIIAQRDVKRALLIQQQLTQLVLEGGDLRALAETLAALVNQSVSIEDEAFEAYANHNIAAVDEARRYTQEHGHTDPRLVDALETRGILPEIRRTLRPVSIPQMPDVGLEMERILAPIVVNSEIYGYVWIIADDRPLGELERMAIESGATIAALLLLRAEAVRREEAIQRGDLLAALMQSAELSDNQAELLLDRALRYGIDLRQPYRLLYVAYNHRTTNQTLPRVTRLYQRATSLIEQEGWSAVAGNFSGHLLVLTQETQALTEIARKLLNSLSTEGDSLRTVPTTRITISAAHTGVKTLAQAYGESRDTLQIAERLRFLQPIITFDDLGYLHTLFRAGAEGLASNRYIPGLRQLLDEQQADLFHTLEVYLDYGGNGMAAAEQLHIHRSSLIYRLGRISQLCDVRLDDPLTRTNLQVALKLLRLFELS